jgi:site-specific DNA recombinase
MTTQTAGYVRLSVTKDESTSVAAQTAILRRWAQANGIEITLYTDDGFSGSKDIERPAYLRMLNDIDAGLISTVVVKSIDRLGRRLGPVIALADKVRIVTVENAIDTDTPTGRLMISLLSVFAEQEARAMGERMIVSIDHRRKAGRSIGLPPFGYRNERRADGAYRVIDGEQAAVVREIGEAVLDGVPITRIADRLNTRQVRTARGRQWSSSTVAQLLDNPTYAGMRPMDDDVMRGDDGLPIVDEELAIFTLAEWARIEQKRQARRAFAPRGDSHERLLLQGLVRCSGCGRAMVRLITTARGKQYHGYRCSADAASLCNTRATISANVLEQYVGAELAPLMAMPILERVTDVDPIAVQRRALLSTEMGTIAASLATAAPEDIGPLAERLTTLRREHDSIAVETIETVTATGQTFGDLWASDPRTVVENAIEMIVVSKASGTRAPASDRVEIVWRDASDYDS